MSLFLPKPAARGKEISPGGRQTTASGSTVASAPSAATPTAAASQGQQPVQRRVPPSSFVSSNKRTPTTSPRPHVPGLDEDDESDTHRDPAPSSKAKGKRKAMTDPVELLSLPEVREQLLRQSKLLAQPGLLASLPNKGALVLERTARLQDRLKELEVEGGVAALRVGDGSVEGMEGLRLDGESPEARNGIGAKERVRLAMMSPTMNSSVAPLSLPDAMALQAELLSREQEASTRRLERIERERQRFLMSTGGQLKESLSKLEGNEKLLAFMFGGGSDDGDYSSDDEDYSEDDDDEANPSLANSDMMQLSSTLPSPTQNRTPLREEEDIVEMDEEEEERELNPMRTLYTQGWERSRREDLQGREEG